jgi:hypothetical protein
MRLPLALLTCLCLVAPAEARMGAGAFRADAYSILKDGPAKPLEAVGDDVIRVSKSPANGLRGWMIEIHAASGARSAAGRLLLFRRARIGPWTQIAEIPFEAPVEAYETLSLTIDDLLAQGETKDDPGLVCLDGNGWVTERRVHGRDVWLTEACSEHDREAEIAKAAAQFAETFGLGFSFPTD